jgi:hypothetical protein
MTEDVWGSGPGDFRIPAPKGPVMKPHERAPSPPTPENKYRTRVEDIDPAHLDPSTMIEYHEKLAAKPSPFTIEGYLQGMSDISEVAITGKGKVRAQARFLVFMTLAAALTPPAILMLGLLHLW